MEEGLYQRHRPRKLSDMLGQDEAISTLEAMLARGSVPHALLLTGPSGCGKTTAARILARRLGCRNKVDFQEINSAESRGIDDIRKIQSRMSSAPMGGKCRIWLLDEVAELTTNSQRALLKTLEDTPRHVYFMLATTDPQKLITTIHTRCTEISFKQMSDDVLETLIRRSLGKENVTDFSDETISLIIESCEGSARKALVIVEQVIPFGDDDRKTKIQPPEMKKKASDLVKALLYDKPDWNKVSSIIKTINFPPKEMERFRHYVMVVASSVLLGGGRNSSRVAAVLDSFETNWFDCPKSGLVSACYRIVGSGRDGR